ncbi:hypothetical protein LOAG_16737 [Loa loa]|uniref:Uncharacterized protein n=1 Tax=Loa loa TaxID=7209 RepID=A0A1S0UKP0_LOALO|nr:hypothetical protein LOAG_16737 [Loa loa]EJD76270.1 hypothetical protein LOAG_16737 [Loa loa]
MATAICVCQLSSKQYCISDCYEKEEKSSTAGITRTDKQAILGKFQSTWKRSITKLRGNGTELLKI